MPLHGHNKAKSGGLHCIYAVCNHGSQDDEEDNAIYEVSEEERPLNAYDTILDKYIGMSAEDLGLNSEVELNLAAHPFSTDYLRLTNLNLNYVRKNL